MPLQKTEAVVLKTQRSGETSKIVTFYTLKFGKLKAVAKGSRSLRSRFFGSLEPLNHVTIVYYFKETREYQFLSQADIINAHDKIKADLHKYAIANVICDLIDRTQIGQANPALFYLLIEILGGIANCRHHLNNYLFWFLLRFLKLSGFQPNLQHCQICRKEQFDGMVRFSLANGGFSCRQCQAPEPSAITVSTATILYLRKLQTMAMNQIEMLAITTESECELLLLSFLRYHIEETKYLTSLKFLRQIQKP
ncbi:MAG: DNA repair protein RecO [candidate division KSB1 bacterium]|nr:DNA repair protein RecO [candidate division KSB1 bacterium]MDZ7319130.1 DNA repair protein RecO [candidate division KSB1 bacterium]MDZ7341793.1 DNA repair protein RecO [candidate division KSB1 bacterium]